MKKVLKNFFSVLLNILIILSILIVFILIYNYIQTKIMKKDYTSLCGYTAFRVISGSMSNAINIGDIVIVKTNQPKENLKQDDIIVFKQENNIITHRIIKITENEIVTKGDANNTEDKPISKEQVIGKIVKIVPNIEIWKKVLTSPEVFISVITTIILFGIAISYKEDNNKENAKEKKEDNNVKKEDSNC